MNQESVPFSSRVARDLPLLD